MAKLLDEFDAIVLAGGCETPRDLSLPGRELFGIEFAMDYLVQQNRRDEGRPIPRDEEILARGRDVVVLGGGDTGADCIGTAIRQGARSVVQFALSRLIFVTRSPEESCSILACCKNHNFHNR